VKEARANIKSKNKWGQTPLSHAPSKSCLEVVKFLMKEAGADVESRDMVYGGTPLSWAAFYSRLEVVKFLVKEVGAEVESKDTKYRYTPLSWATWNCCPDVVKWLVWASANVESKDKDGKIALDLT